MSRIAGHDDSVSKEDTKALRKRIRESDTTGIHDYS